MAPNQDESPVLSETMLEVQGIFPSDAALQDAIGRLTRLGFDRARLSLPAASPAPQDATPSAGADNPNTEDDDRQVRTLHSSMAGAAGAMLGAGIVAATGGAALPAVAAAAGLGLASGGTMFAASTATNAVQHEHRQADAARGELVLAVAISGPDEAPRAEGAMRDAGAQDVKAVRREGAGIAAVAPPSAA